MTAPPASLPLTGRPPNPAPAPEGEWRGAETLQPPPPPGAPGVAAAELSAALPLRWWSWTLPRPLERRFAAQWAAEQSARFTPITVIGVLAFLALTIGDDRIAPREAGVLDALRWSIVVYTALFLAVRSLSRWRRWPIPPAVFSLCYTTGATVMGAYVTVINRAAPTDVESVRCSAVLLIFLSTSLVARLPLGMCIASGATSMALYAAAVAPVGGPGHAVVVSNLRLFLMSFAFTVAVRWSIDRSQRAAWVLHELDVVRRADLSAGTEVLRQLGMRDPLTGLGNRRRLDEALASPDRGARPLLVLALDIDDFKAYNDSYGHLGGDACLRAVAGALQDVASRLGGMATRVGGEEFTLVLPDAGLGTASTARDAAGAVCAAVRALGLPHAASRCSDVVTVSVGVAAVGPDRGGDRAAEVREALLVADRALYQAKNGGRDRWVVATTHRTARAALSAPQPAVVPDPGDPPAAMAVAARPKHARPTAQAVERYWAQAPAVRQRRLSALAIGFSPVVVLLAAADGQLFPDVAPGFVAAMTAVEVLAVVWFSLALRMRLPWRSRVRPLVAAVALLGVVLLWGVHESRAPLAMVPLLSLVLLPMFLAFVVGAPFCSFALVCLVLFAGMLAVTFPWGGSQTSIATNVVKVDLIAGAYAAFGHYLLQRGRLLEFALGVREGELCEALSTQQVDLEVLATRDPLTGLTNRRAFEHFLAKAQKDAAAVAAPVALLLLDVDHFKAYNDTAGHPAGDEVLRRLGGTLAAWATATCHDLPVWTGPPASLASRWGGEEFGILLPGVAAPEALVLAEQVRTAVADLGLPHPCSPVGECVTVSIGVAAMASAGDPVTPAEVRRRLLTQADEALYRAKAAGRDRAAS